MTALQKIFGVFLRIGRDRAHRSGSEDARSRPLFVFFLLFFLHGYAFAESLYTVSCGESVCASKAYTSKDEACSSALANIKTIAPYNSPGSYWLSATVVVSSSGSACVVSIPHNPDRGWVINTSSGCATGKHWDSSSQTCKDDKPTPVNCPSGQDGSSGKCVPTGNDGKTPNPGDKARPISIPVGTTDPSGNFKPYPDGPLGDPSSGGGSAFGRKYNCDGWQCSVIQSDTVPNSCVYKSDGVTYCNYVPEYTGNPAVPSDTNAPSPQTGDTNDKLPSAGCPAGYTLNSSTGLCTSGGTSGTPSTSGQPGSSGDDGSAACPTGYTRGADGRCTGTGNNPGSTGACPSGYTQDASGYCVSTGQIGNNGKPDGGGTGHCGGTNEPPCEVDWGEFKPHDPDAISDGDGIRGLMKSPVDDLLNWTPQTSGGECPTPSFSMFGRSFTISSHCELMDGLRGVIESVSLFIWAISALFIVLSA